MGCTPVLVWHRHCYFLTCVKTLAQQAKQTGAIVAITFEKALGTYEAALKLRSKRAEVLAANLANSDTPNFKARDFDFQKALSSELARGQTNKGSNVNSMTNSVNSAMQYRIPAQPSVDGNTVDEHLEHAEFMANSLEHQTAFTLLNSRFKGLISAIRGE